MKTITSPEDDRATSQVIPTKRRLHEPEVEGDPDPELEQP